MPTPRDPASAAGQVLALLERVRRRVWVRHALLAAAAFLLTAAMVSILFRLAGASAAVRLGGAACAGAIVAGSLLWRGRRQRSGAAAAVVVERSYPSLRNLLVTAQELLAAPDGVPVYMRERVVRETARAIAGVDSSRALPLGRETIAAAIGALLLFVSLPSATDGLRVLQPPAIGHESARAGVADLLVAIEPPAYTHLPSKTLRNPQAVTALAGSTATIRVLSRSPAIVRINGVTAEPKSDGSSQVVLGESGAVAVDAAGQHRVIPLTVTPDAKPDVRVTAPGKDLRVVDTHARIPIHVTATDDLDLRALDVRYTIVSGAGEQFTFVEGTVPAAVTRQSGRAWRADASLALADHKLEPGDSLIYRAVAADGRPGTAGEASSDTYFVEIAGPGDVPLEGVDMPPDKERYALSEAMIVVKIQRLMAAERGMRRAEVAETAANIAAEQRAVRANFVFLLGGEVEDEVVEAEASHEIQEGRLANQARRDIVAATVLMAKVEQALAAVSTKGALPPAQEAVRALQRAFGHNRYLLRALPSRIRIDPSRRLSGDAAGVRDWSRQIEPPAPDARAAAARAALAGVAAIARDPGAPDALARLSSLAERLLTIEPGAADLQAASRLLLQAREALARADVPNARKALQGAVGPLIARAGHERIDLPFASRDALRLTGAAAEGGR